MLYAGSMAEVGARVNCARLAISILSHWLAHQRLNYTTRRSLLKVTGGARTPQRLYVPPIPHTERGGLLKGSDRAVTTCRLPLQTGGIVVCPIVHPPLYL